MPWQLAITFSVIASAATNLIQRRYAKRSDLPETIPSALSFLLGVLPVGIIIGLILPHHVHWSLRLDELLAIVATTSALSGWIGFKAVKLMSVAPYQTISRITIVLVIGLGWIVLDEKLTLNQSIGAVILLAAAFLAAWAPIKNKVQSLNITPLKAVFLALLGFTFLAIALVTQKAVLGHMQVGGVLIIDWGLQTLAMLILMLKDINRKSLIKLTGYEIKWSSLMGMANGVNGAFYLVALNRSNNISVITSLTAITLPLTVIGAHFLLKERDKSKLMWLSIAMCFIGLLVYAAGGL